MKLSFIASLLCLAAGVMGGCSSRHVGPVYHAGDEKPPQFLTGPIAPVLTNLSGFSAQITWTAVAADGAPVTTSGQLLEREGRMIFQPTLAIKGRRARTEGGLFFIWDEEKHAGYVLSEALQGYAPITTDVHSAGAVTLAKPGIQEQANGHPCHRAEGVVDLSNGLKARVTVWQADDLPRHFPVRIEAVDETGRMTLNLAEIRHELPNPTIFRPPDGFSTYATSVALMNELIVRDASLASKYHSADFPDEPAPVNNSNWRQPVPGAY